MVAADRTPGRLKVFIGMAAGVGKTYRMLLEGHAEQEAGRDIVIGLLETHGRDETARVAEGLPIIARRRVRYRETSLEEMDLPAILARAPELCLVDELAHTNVPGTEHAKRHEAEDAIIMPAFLAQVPMNLPLETPLPVQCSRGMPLLEAIEQRATSQGVPVDSRVGRGRSARDALRKLIEQENFDRIIVSADEDPRVGLSYEDLRWMLDRVPAEIMILRPAPQDKRKVSTEAVRGHF